MATCSPCAQAQVAGQALADQVELRLNSAFAEHHPRAEPNIGAETHVLRQSPQSGPAHGTRRKSRSGPVHPRGIQVIHLGRRQRPRRRFQSLLQNQRPMPVFPAAESRLNPLLQSADRRLAQRLIGLQHDAGPLAGMERLVPRPLPAGSWHPPSRRSLGEETNRNADRADSDT